MDIKTRPLNKGETFCCSFKKAKEIFKDTEVFLNFAYTGRHFSTFAETPDGYYWARNVKGKVICEMLTSSGKERPILSFYVLKEKNFSDELKDEFEQKCLPEFYRLYKELLNDHVLAQNTKMMLVEFFDGKLKLHETTLQWR